MINFLPDLSSDRLVYRVPTEFDARSIYQSYAANEQVVQYLGWPRHQSLADTEQFLQLAQQEWQQHGMGPVLIFLKSNNELIGSTGISFLKPGQGMTGYVLVPDQWGRGYATEALQSMLGLAEDKQLGSLVAFVHPDHDASIRVLLKCGFAKDKPATTPTVFPNLPGSPKLDALRFIHNIPGGGY